VLAKLLHLEFYKVMNKRQETSPNQKHRHAMEEHLKSFLAEDLLVRDGDTTTQYTFAERKPSQLNWVSDVEMDLLDNGTTIATASLIAHSVIMMGAYSIGAGPEATERKALGDL
jgi:hypothetical protein